MGDVSPNGPGVQRDGPRHVESSPVSQWTPEQIAALERATGKPVVVHKPIDDREWCRAFIDHNCIYRSPPWELAITSQDGGVAAWQFYLPIAILNQEFAPAVGRLFWLRYAEKFQREPFQLCGCESGGSLLASVLQSRSFNVRPVNVFMVKKAAKTYGLKNWLEGVVLPDVPVLLVDDVVGSGKTISQQRCRLYEFGLKIAGTFAIAAVKQQDARMQLNNPIDTLYKPSDFARLHEEYVRKYGKQPEFRGTVV